MLKFRVQNKASNKISEPFTFGDLYGYEGETNAVTLFHPFTGGGQDFTITSHGGGNPLYPQMDSWKGVNPDLIFFVCIGKKDDAGNDIYEQMED